MVRFRSRFPLRIGREKAPPSETFKMSTYAKNPAVELIFYSVSRSSGLQFFVTRGAFSSRASDRGKSNFIAGYLNGVRAQFTNGAHGIPVEALVPKGDTLLTTIEVTQTNGVFFQIRTVYCADGIIRFWKSPAPTESHSRRHFSVWKGFQLLANPPSRRRS